MSVLPSAVNLIQNSLFSVKVSTCQMVRCLVYFSVFFISLFLLLLMLPEYKERELDSLSSVSRVINNILLIKA